MKNYAELCVTSNFSFLQGASHPEEFVTQAAALNYKAIAITDHNSLAGIVRAHGKAQENNINFVVGCRLNLQEELLSDYDNSCASPEQTTPPKKLPVSLFVYPLNRAAYGRLCTLLTLGKRRAPKGECLLSLTDYLEHQKDLATTILANRCDCSFDELYAIASKIKTNLSDKRLLSLALVKNYSNRNSSFQKATIESANKLFIPLVASNDVYYHQPQRRMLQDVLTCIQHQCSISKAGFRLFENGERYLKHPVEMQRLFRDIPEALDRGCEISEMCSGFSLEQLKYEYPDEICPAGKNSLEYLSELTWQGAKEHYPNGIPAKVSELIVSELKLIHELSYEKYFLTCYDIVKVARQKGILCQGRGAAANSAVCFCLGITSVDPERIELLFARFVSKERSEPPDIDIDFEHERREEIIQYIYQKYGRAHAGLTAEVITYRHRSALRDVGKALGLSQDAVDKLAKSTHYWTNHVVTEQDLKQIGLSANSSSVQNIFRLAEELIGFPRHLSQHVGGFIICQKPLSETVPILNAAMEERTIIEWDKDDIEKLGMLKIDVLALGMLTCIRKALTLVNRQRAQSNLPMLELYNIPAEDPLVYEMISNADTVGVFQIESRAQMSMLPRLKPRCFYDLVIEVAIVRPGPIHGKMVHPYLKRRDGLEKAHYPDPRVEKILGKTLGVPLFQEQAMRLAITLANFTPGEAEKLRRAMAAWKRDGGAILLFKQRILEGMGRNGYSEEFAENCINQLKGFSEYGFPESHAASFALLVYASAWLKCHHPAEFMTALLNSQPMGFYAPAQIIRDGIEHGVEVLPIDINFSLWETKIVAPKTVRTGMHLVKGLAEEQAKLICEAVKKHGPFPSALSLWLFIKKQQHGDNLRFSRSTLQTLAQANAFQSMGLNQREALWEIKALPEDVLPLDSFAETSPAQSITLPRISAQQSMFQDYEMTGFSLKGHPIGFLREKLNKLKAKSAATLKTNIREFKGQNVITAGCAIFKQRPNTASGIVFITLEDESGVINLIIKPDIFQAYQKIIFTSSCLLAIGKVEYVGKQVYISVTSLKDLDWELHSLEKTPASFCPTADKYLR